MPYASIVRCLVATAVLFTLSACEKKRDATPAEPAATAAPAAAHDHEHAGAEPAAAHEHDHGHPGAVPGSYDDWCGEHQVPESLCTRCNPSLIAAFKATGDWCEKHGLPESQCLICNPELKIERPPRADESNP